MVLRRRDVLGLLAALAAGPALGGVRDGVQDGGDLLARICARAGGDAELAALGRAQCAARPGVTRAAWIEELARSLPAVRWGTEAELVGQLRARAAADFRERRIVALEGWRLSVTEARICAAGVAPVRGSIA